MANTQTVSLLRYLFSGISGLLEVTVKDLTTEQVHLQPPGTANSIAANYAHVVTGHDGIFNGKIKQGAPLFASEWAGKTGLSELPPSMGEGLPDWTEWARRVTVDMDQFRTYAQAVYASADQILATLTDDDLEQSAGEVSGLGELTVKQFLFQIALGHITMHVGEISCLKGIQGLKGLPM